MIAVYELLDLLPAKFTPTFAPRLNALCEFLMNHERMSQVQAAECYLGDRRRIKYFNTLKNDLKKALIRYFIVNPSLAEGSGKALIEDCYRQFTAYKILLLGGKRIAAIELATTLLARLKVVEIFSLSYEICRDLFNHYSNFDSNLSKSKKYEHLMQFYLKQMEIETHVLNYHNRVTLLCNTREAFNPQHIAYFNEAMKATEPSLELGSTLLNRYIYNIITICYSATSDHEMVLYYCDEALKSFSTEHPRYRSLRFSFLHKKIPALLAIGKNEEAKMIARETSALVKEGGFNWHLALLKRTLVCFRAGDYQEAYELYKAHRQETCNSKVLVEYWKILQGYLYFLIQRGYIEPYEDERFYLGKFLNEVPLYSKDKAGQNINILILQILIQLQREQFGNIIDRVDSLREYIRAYTRKPETKRANLFIRMILKMESAQFHRAGTELKTEKLREQLDATPLHFGQNLAVEIIPFTVLWQEILQMLANKFRGTTVRRSRPSKGTSSKSN